jgi:hypothetical protein
MDNQLFNYNKLLDTNNFVFNNQNLLSGIIDEKQINLLANLNTCPVVSEELTSSITNLKNVFSKCNNVVDKFKCSYDLLMDPKIKELIKNIINMYTKINFKCTVAINAAISNDRKNTICSTQNKLDQEKIIKIKQILETYIDIIKQIRDNIKTNIKQFNEFCYSENKSNNDNVLAYLSDIDKLLGQNVYINHNGIIQEEIIIDKKLDSDSDSSSNVLLYVVIIIVIVIVCIIIIIIYVYVKNEKMRMNFNYNQRFIPRR